MLRISMMALVRILANNNYQYVIQNSNEFEEGRVIKFVGSLDTSNGGQYIMTGTPSDVDGIRKDRQALKNAQILMHYDMKNMSVIGCCAKWKELFSEQRSVSKDALTINGV